MNELSKELRCVSVRGGVEIWVEKERVEQLEKILTSSDRHGFIKFGDEVVNTADVVGIFTPATMEEVTRRKNGEWKCKQGNWHERREKCGCKESKLTGEELGKFSAGRF